MSREWLVERRSDGGSAPPEIVVYPVDGGPVSLDDVSWVIARLANGDGEPPVPLPVVPGPVRWEYTGRLAYEVDVACWPDEPLGEGWEPFAVVEHLGETWVHLRRKVGGA